jgi:hypothetical protein
MIFLKGNINSLFRFASTFGVLISIEGVLSFYDVE